MLTGGFEVGPKLSYRQWCHQIAPFNGEFYDAVMGPSSCFLESSALATDAAAELDHLTRDRTVIGPITVHTWARTSLMLDHNCLRTLMSRGS